LDAGRDVNTNSPPTRPSRHTSRYTPADQPGELVHRFWLDDLPQRRLAVLYYGRMLHVATEILTLVGIRIEVEEHRRQLHVVDVFVFAAPDHIGGGYRAGGMVFGEDGTFGQ